MKPNYTATFLYQFLLIQLLIRITTPALGQKNSSQVDSSQYYKASELLDESVSYRENDRDKALEKGNEALVAAQKSKSLPMMASASKNLGIIHYFRGEAGLAANYYSKALDLYLKTGDKHGAGSCYNNLALIHQQKGDFKKAYNLFLNSFNIDRYFGDTSGMATSCSNLGNIQFFRGEYKSAYYYYMKCYQLTKHLKDTLGLSDIHINLANIYKETEQYEKAISHYKTAIKYAAMVNSLYNRAISLYNLGDVYVRKNELMAALKVLNESLVLREELGDKAGEATVLAMIARVYEDLGYRLKANELYMSSLKINEEMGNQRMIAHDMVQIGRNLLLQKQASKALPYAREGVTIANRIGDYAVLLDSYRMLALTWAALNQHDSAVACLNLYTELKTKVHIDSLKYLTGRRLTKTVESPAHLNQNKWTTFNIACTVMIVCLVILNIILLYRLWRGYRKARI